MIVPFIFWASVIFIAYVYAGYPLLLILLREVRRNSRRTEPSLSRLRTSVAPKVSLLVSAYNEAAVIAAKLRNAMALDYPVDRLEIVIASDGSIDGTAEIVREFNKREGQGRVRLFDFPTNRGKITTLNEAVPHLRGDIIVFSDATSMLAKDSIRHLVANFADSRVGAASGIYRVLNSEHAHLGAQEGLYWKYETFLKLQEAELGCVLGAHGSMFAVRKELYCFPSASTINDDFIIPVRVLQQGFRIAYDAGAIAYEEAQEMEGFTRRVRIVRGNLQQLREMRGLLRPLRPLPLLCFASHKAARLVVPIAMILLAISNFLLWQSPFYAALAVAQGVFYGLALCGALWPMRPTFLRLPYYFCMINAAVFAWMFQALRSQRAASAKPVDVIWNS